MTVWTNQSPAHSRGCVILLKMRRERQTELNPKIVTVASNHATVHGPNVQELIKKKLVKTKIPPITRDTYVTELSTTARCPS